MRFAYAAQVTAVWPDAFSLTDSLPLPLADRAGNPRDGVLRMLPPASTNVDDAATGSVLGLAAPIMMARPLRMTDLADFRPMPSLNALTADERYCPRRHAALLPARRLDHAHHRDWHRPRDGGALQPVGPEPSDGALVLSHSHRGVLLSGHMLHPAAGALIPMVHRSWFRVAGVEQERDH
jgi:hypothetical protein